MRHDRLAACALLLLGASVALNAILGPLLLGIIRFHVSQDARTQLLGGEIVSLAVVVPVALLAGGLWLRGHWLAPLLAAPPALYALYNSITFVVGPEYSRYAGNNERAFPLYLALIVLGWIVALRAWSALAGVSQSVQTGSPRRSLGVLLLLTGAVFALAWLGSLAPVLNGNAPSQQYADDPALFWVIRTLDLGFVIPATLLAGIGLLRSARWAARLGLVVAGFATLYVAAVATMAAAMQAHNDPAASPLLLIVSTLLALALAVLFVRLVRAVARTAAHRPASATRSPSRSGGGPPLRPAAGRR